MNTPCRYFGGKSNMIKNILEQFPEKGTYNTYIEPFSGSFSVALHTSENRIVPNEIYNDLNRNVYSLYKILQDKELFKQFKERCDLIIYNEDLRKEYKEKLKTDDLSLLDRAYMFFYVNRTSHNGIGGFSTNLVVRRNMSKSISDMLSCIDRLPELHQRLSKVIVLNQDAFKLIEKYNTENIFLYCDPPYHHDTRGTTRYDIDMTNEQHELFINLCLNSNAKILISGYDCEPYDKLVESGWKKIQFEVNTIDGKMKPKTKVETLWKNY